MRLKPIRRRITHYGYYADRLVAHRGYQRCFLKCLLSIIQAIDAGAKWVEFDVQFNDEGIMLYHDDNLSRVSGVERSIWLATELGQFLLVS